MEIKDVVGFPGYYVSDTGELYSDLRGDFKKLKGWKDSRGYHVVDLRKDGQRHGMKIHRLVAFAFIENPENKPFINHINGVRDDNRVSNLEWVTHRENVDHAMLTGLVPTGEDRSTTIRTTEEIKEVCELLEQGVVSCNRLEQLTGVPHYICSQIKCGDIWTCISKNYKLPPVKRRKPPLSEDQIKEICLLLNSGLRPYEIVQRTEYSFDVISNIKTGRAYSKISKKYLHEAPTTIESTSEDVSE